MNEHVNQPTTDIAAVVADNPVLVLTDAAKYSAFYEHIKREVEAHVPDLDSDKGRKAIASLAYKVTRTKTAIDAAGKQLNEEARKQINVVDAQRRKVREELDALADKVRKPLDEWEEREAARKQIVVDMLEQLGRSAPAASDGTPEIEAALAKIEPLTFDEAVYQDELPRVEHAHRTAVDLLRKELARSRQADADRAELDRLRKEAAEREARDAEDRAAREAEEVAARQRKAEEDAQAAAAEEARKREAAAAEAAREEEQRKTAAALAAAEAEKQALLDEQARVERERKAEEQRQAEEQAAREANKAHRNKILGEAAEGLMEAAGISSLRAHKIVLSIAAGQIPHVTLRF